MMTVGERIKNLREKLGMSQVDFADKINVSKQTLYKYENNIITNIPSDKIEAVAAIGNVSPAYLMGWDTNVSPIRNGMKQKRPGVTINVLGRVAAGAPIEAIEAIIDTEEITEEMAATGEFFGLQINGDSMEPKMSKGDVVIVRQQDDAESGDTVIVTVNGTDATCKRLRKYRDGIELISTNPSYGPMFFTNEDIENKPVKIIGKVVELRCKF
ncbi:XRE family transcriptional regulator [[Clostridium] symbiosum]|uniref:LexA family protein n=1 Tax=Clostridium symbiosum TaxID=1512 RepID=UPI001897C066|nr:XRE family transcriptional regulator [[Clostridium] symbiosum]MDB2016769.1 XRE family transcriptional regulator [[Clostridium] symbiosum]MDB2033960.1 XRE family transcriptional regulator [[Clostridium] symbiosum]